MKALQRSIASLEAQPSSSRNAPLVKAGALLVGVSSMSTPDCHFSQALAAVAMRAMAWAWRTPVVVAARSTYQRV